MYRKIVVPADLTEKNRAAVATACELARGGGEILLLHVIETIEDETELDEFYTRLEAKARAGLERLATVARAQGLAVRTEVVYGRRVERIVAEAAAAAADLIVLASHRLEPGPPGRDWLTISFRVALLAPCAVLLVK
jgi:nucleotide-binding universal stress UspA family protein